MSNSKYKNQVVRLTQMLESTFQQIQYHKKRDVEREVEMQKLLTQIQHMKKQNEKSIRNMNMMPPYMMTETKAKEQNSVALNKMKAYMEKISQILKSGLQMNVGKRNSYNENRNSELQRTFSKACNGFIKYQQEYVKSCVSKQLMKLETEKLRKQNTSLFQLTAELQQNFVQSDKITKKYLTQLKLMKNEIERLNQQNRELMNKFQDERRSHYNMKMETSLGDMKYKAQKYDFEHIEEVNKSRDSQIVNERKMWLKKNQQLYEQIRMLNMSLVKSEQKLRNAEQKLKLQGRSSYSANSLNKSRVKQLQQQVSVLVHKLQESEQQKQKIITVYQNQEHQAKDRIIRHQDTIMQLQKKFKNIRHRYEQLLKTVESKDSKIRDYQNNIKQLQQKLNNINFSHHEHEEYANNHNEYNNGNSNNNVNGMKYVRQEDRLSRILNDSQSNIKQRQSSQLRQRIIQLQQTIKQTKQEQQIIYEQLQRDKERIKAQNSQLRNKNKKIQEEYYNDNRQLSSLKLQIQNKEEVLNEYESRRKNINKYLNQLIQTYSIDDTDKLLEMLKDKINRQTEHIKDLTSYRESVINEHKDSQVSFSNEIKMLNTEVEEGRNREDNMIGKLNQILKIKEMYVESERSLQERWMQIFNKMEANANNIKKERQQMDQIENAWWQKQRKLIRDIEQLKEEKGALMRKVEQQQHNTEYEVKISNLDNANNILTNKVQQLNGTVSALNTQITKYNIKIQQLNNKISQKDHKVNGLSAKLKENNIKDEEYISKLSIKDNQITAMKSKLQQKQATNKQYKNNVQELVKEIQLLMEDKQELKSIVEEGDHNYHKLQQQSKQLKEDHCILQENLQHKIVQIKQEQSINKSFREKIGELTQYIQNNKNQQNIKEDKCKQINNKLLKINNKLLTVRKQSWQCKQYLQTNINNINKEIANTMHGVQSMVKTKQQKYNKHQQERIIKEHIQIINNKVVNKHLQKEINNINEAMNHKNKEIQQYKTKYNSKEQLVQNRQLQLAKLQLQVGNYKQKAHKMEKQHKEECDKLKQESQCREKTIRQMETNAGRLNAKIAQLNKRISENKELKELKEKEEELKRKTDKIQALKQEMVDRIKQCVQYKEKLQQKIVQLQEQKEMLQNREKGESIMKQYYEEQLNKKDNMISNLQISLSCINDSHQLQQLNIQLQTVKKENREIKAFSMQRQQKIQKLNQQTHKLNRIVKEKEDRVREEEDKFREKTAMVQKHKQFITELQDSNKELLNKVKYVNNQQFHIQRLQSITINNQHPSKGNLYIQNCTQYSYIPVQQEENKALFKSQKEKQTQLKTKQIQNLYLNVGEDQGQTHLLSIKPYKQDISQLPLKMGRKEGRQMSQRNYKQQQLVSQLKITQQYKEIIQAQNKNLKKEIIRKDKICNKFKEMEKLLVKYKKQLEKVQTQLKLKDITLMKNQKELKTKIEEVVKANRLLESLNEELSLQRKRNKHFQSLYEKYKMQKKPKPTQ